MHARYVPLCLKYLPVKPAGVERAWPNIDTPSRVCIYLGGFPRPRLTGREDASTTAPPTAQTFDERSYRTVGAN